MAACSKSSSKDAAQRLRFLGLSNWLEAVEGKKFSDFQQVPSSAPGLVEALF